MIIHCWLWNKSDEYCLMYWTDVFCSWLLFQIIKYIIRGFVYFFKFITEISNSTFFVKHPSVSPVVLPPVCVFSILFVRSFVLKYGNFISASYPL